MKFLFDLFCVGHRIDFHNCSGACLVLRPYCNISSFPGKQLCKHGQIWPVAKFNKTQQHTHWGHSWARCITICKANNFKSQISRYPLDIILIINWNSKPKTLLDLVTKKKPHGTNGDPFMAITQVSNLDAVKYRQVKFYPCTFDTHTS